MHNLSIWTLLITCTLFSGCALENKRLDVGPSHVHYPMLITDKVQQVQVGEYLFREANFSLVEGIKLLTPVNAMSKNILAPKFSLPANTVLPKSFSKGKYYYYAIAPQKTFKDCLKITLSDIFVGPRKIDQMGIQQLANTQEFKLFASAEGREYLYPFPNDAQWTKVERHDRSYSGNENALIYLGRNDNKLIFNHRTYLNSPKKNLLGSNFTAETKETSIKIPISQSELLIDGRVIEIIEANDNIIRFRLKAS